MKVIVRAFSEGHLVREALLAAISESLEKALAHKRGNEERDGPRHTYEVRQTVVPGRPPTRVYVEVNVSDF